MLSEIEIARPRADVAAYAPIRTTPPRGTTKAVEWQSPPPLAVGPRRALVAQFLGRRLAYTYEVTGLVPSKRLVTRRTGPFDMERTSAWQDAGEGATRMTLLTAVSRRAWRS